MRLIDADAFMEYLGLDTGVAREENLGVIVGTEDLDRQPTAYDVDKVLEQLEHKAENSIEYWKEFAYKDSIDIVKSGGIE